MMCLKTYFKYTLVAIICFTSACSHAQLEGKVVSVIDGDTFILLNAYKQQVRIRLYGIDCPERAQDFGQAAKKYAGDLVFNKVVKVTDKGLDRYGRTLGIVYLDTLNINEKLIQEGYAWHYVYYDKNPAWDADEANARERKKGLWVMAAPVPPWDWRRHH